MIFFMADGDVRAPYFRDIRVLSQSEMNRQPMKKIRPIRKIRGFQDCNFTKGLSYYPYFLRTTFS